MSRGRFSLITLVLLLALVWSIRAHSQSSNPAPTFVGSQACATCHTPIHTDWKGARHSKMIQPATAASVVGDFSKDSVTLKGQRYRLRVANGEYFISESYLTGKEQEHKVELTLGSRRIQHYLTTIERGSIIVLPPSWDVQRREWFDNMDIVRPVEQELRRVSRQPAGEQLPGGGPHLQDGVGRLRHVVRAMSRPRERSRPGVRAWRERSRRW